MRSLLSLATGLLLVITIAPVLLSSNREQDRTATSSAWREYRRHKLVRDPRILLEQRSQLSGETGEKAWLLEPQTFDQLSTAGQRAALFANGLIELEDRRPATSVPRPSVSPRIFTAGENVRVNDPSADAGGHTQSETSIAVRGSNIVVSFNDANADGSGYAFSTDGGNSFTHRRIPTPPGGFNLGDGVVTFGPNGELYYATLAFTASRQSIIGVAKSLDHGATFNSPADASTTAGNNSDFQDKEWVAVDTGSSSPFRGNVYVSWTDFTSVNGNFINFSRSVDGGITFDAPVNLSPRDGTQVVQGSVPAVAPNGDVYVAYFDVHGGLPKIAVVKSTDGGQTFGLPVTASLLNPVGAMTGGGGVRANSFASMAIDNAGQVHIVFTALPAGERGDRGDVYYVRSSDGGASFSAAARLNDDKTKTTQFFPSIAAAADGSLGVKWWDRRNDTVNDSLTDVYMTISQNGGNSFGKNFRITDHNWVFGPIEPGFAAGYHGDYDGIATDGNSFFVSWSDERNADPDAYFTQVPVTRDADAPDFNISARKVYDSVVAGNSVSFEFATSGSSGFTGSLSVSAAPAVSGLTYFFSPSSVTAGQITTLTITSAASTRPGTFLITILANGSGITRKTNFRLTTLSASFPGQPPQNITKTPGFTDSRSALQIDSSGTIHHVFEDDTAAGAFGDEVFYFNSTDGGKTFSAPLRLSIDGDIAFDPALAVDQTGNLYATWVGFNPALGGLKIFVSKSSDHGATFSQPVAVSGNALSPQFPSIVAGRSEVVFVAFTALTNSRRTAFGVRSADGGGTFGDPFFVSGAFENVNGRPFVALNSRGAAYVVYNEISTGAFTIELATAADGQQFAPAKVVSDRSIAAFAPHVAVDLNDNLYVAFYNRILFGILNVVNREIELIRSTDGGKTFRHQVNVSRSDDGQSRFPFLILDRQAVVNVVWEETQVDGLDEVMFARSVDGGLIFADPVNLSGNSGISSNPAGSVDSSGRVFVNWIDDSLANTEVLVSERTFPATEPDFDLGFLPPGLIGLRPQAGAIVVHIGRISGFAGKVTVSPPQAGALRIKISPSTLSTTEESVIFNFKIKKKATVGTHFLTFSGRDDNGRVRSGTLTLFIQ